MPYTPATASTDDFPLFQWPDLDFEDLEDIFLGRQVPVVGSPPKESKNSTNDLPRPFTETDAETNMLEEDMAAQILQELYYILWEAEDTFVETGADKNMFEDDVAAHVLEIASGSQQSLDNDIPQGQQNLTGNQGGRTWQPFVGRKNGNENFRQAHIYNFCVKCVVFARNHKFAKLTQ